MSTTRNISRLLLVLFCFCLTARAESDDYLRSKQKLEKLKERFTSQSWVEGDSLSEVTNRIFGRGIQSQPDGLLGAKPQDLFVQERLDDATDGPPKNGRSGPPAIGGTSTLPPRWMPYCFLVDPAQDGEQVNQAIKTMADEYARCGVALDAHAFTIDPGYPQDPDELNQLAREACDFGRAFEARGAIQIWNGNPQITQQMCDDPAAVGCSTLCERLSVSQVSPGQGAYVAMHESLHSNCCGRACVDPGAGTEPAGYGVFLVKNAIRLSSPLNKVYWAETQQDAPRVGDDQPEGEQVTPAACAAILPGTSENEGLHRYDPAKQTYYVAATDPAAYKQLNGESFFTPKPNVPEIPLQGKGVAGKGGGGLGGNGDGNTISFTEAPKGRPVPDTSRHKGKEDGSALLVGINRDKPTNGIQYLNGLQSESRTGQTGPRITFNDNNQKLGSTGGSSSYTNSDATQTPLEAGAAMVTTESFSNQIDVPESAGGSNGAARIGFNDSAKKVSAQGSSLSLPGGEGTTGAEDVAAVEESFGEQLGRGFSSLIEGASALSTSLTSGFFGSGGDGEELTEDGKRERGATLRARRGFKRDSSVGLKKRSDVIISARPDPNFQVAPAEPYPGTY